MRQKKKSRGAITRVIDRAESESIMLGRDKFRAGDFAPWIGAHAMLLVVCTCDAAADVSIVLIGAREGYVGRHEIGTSPVQCSRRTSQRTMFSLCSLSRNAIGQLSRAVTKTRRMIVTLRPTFSQE